MVQSKSQRVGVFVDIQNMYYSARYLYNTKVDFRILLRTAIQNRTLIRAFAYVIRADMKEEESFFDALKKIGYEVRSKDLQVFVGGAKKGDWDIGMAMDTIELAPKLDTVVLVSGDGDFVPLVRHLKYALGCRVEVLAFGRSSASKLVEEADDFYDLDKMSHVLQKRRIVPRGGAPATTADHPPSHPPQDYRHE